MFTLTLDISSSAAQGRLFLLNGCPEGLLDRVQVVFQALETYLRHLQERIVQGPSLRQPLTFRFHGVHLRVQQLELDLQPCNV